MYSSWFASNASVRGFSSDHSTDVALWEDGVPTNEAVNGHAEGYSDWNLLFPEAIAGMDVTGPAMRNAAAGPAPSTALAAARPIWRIDPLGFA